MTDIADDHFQTILDLSDQLLAISELGYSCFDHDGCLLLNGIVRDCAFRLRDAAEAERSVHLTQGIVSTEPEVKRYTGNNQMIMRSSTNNLARKEI